MNKCVRTLQTRTPSFRRVLQCRSLKSLSGNDHEIDLKPMTDEELVLRRIKKSSALADPGSIYKQLPNAETEVIGTKRPKLKFAWNEENMDVFPSSPEEAGLSLLHYLEQKDMWRRRKQIHIPKFSVGSIIRVTRADRLHPQGQSTFVGLCININYKQNTKGANFTLRNVLFDEPLEIRYPFYNPLIQSIEVLRHQRWENEIPVVGLRFLRDYPPAYSAVDENMEPEEYTEEPSVRPWTDEDKTRLKAWFKAIYDSRRRPQKRPK